MTTRIGKRPVEEAAKSERRDLSENASFSEQTSEAEAWL